MTRLLLIRHGESEANRNGTIAGQLDADLLEKGLQQAKITAQYIVENYKVDAVYASDLQRAYKTGKAVADLLSLPTIPDSRLREVMAGQWAGMKFGDILEQFHDDYTHWLSDIGNSRCTGGESVKELGERVVESVTEIAKKHDGETVVVATHATPIRVLQCLIEAGTLDEMKNIPWVSNCSVTELLYENGAWCFGAIGIDDHLADMRTAFPKNI